MSGSSHQDYLQRLRLAHVLQSPAQNLTSVLPAHIYTEIKAFVLETSSPSSGSSLLCGHQEQYTPLKVDAPGAFMLRGLPLYLESECPPTFPMCGSDDLAARANRTPPRGYPSTPGACFQRPAVDGFTAVQRCVFVPPCRAVEEEPQ